MEERHMQFSYHSCYTQCTLMSSILPVPDPIYRCAKLLNRYPALHAIDVVELMLN